MVWPFTSSPKADPPTPPPADKCPVDHETRNAWLAANPGATSPFQPKDAFVQAASSSTQDSSSPAPGPSTRTRRLSEDRVISSIPRYGPESEPESAPPSDTNWVYPSEGQFFRAMLRKHNAGLYGTSATPPNPSDMNTIVPIHNAVNERAWAEVLKWEEGQGGGKCGGVRLVSFKGRPKDRTPKAWMNVALGYTAPFDRHDWVIDRCGEQVRYVIDFYSGRPSPDSPMQSKPGGNLSFYLDVRPALDGWEGARLRASRLFGL